MIELTAEQCREVLERGTVVHVGVVDAGEPYVTPMSYVVIGEEIVFRTVPGRRVEAIRAHPRVCLEVALESDAGWRSVVLWGDARIVEDPGFESEAVAALLAKYHGESAIGSSAPTGYPAPRLVVAVRPETIGGRASGSLLGGESRPGRI